METSTTLCQRDVSLKRDFVNAEPSTSTRRTNREDDEEIFYDAGESIQDNSSDTTPPDLCFSVANEDLPTDVSDTSDVYNSPPAPRQHKVRKGELPSENLDDISTDCASSTEENGFYRFREINPSDDNQEFNNEVLHECVNNELNQSADVANEETEKSVAENYSSIRENRNLSDDIESVQQNNISEMRDSMSSMEVMDDDVDGRLSEDDSNGRLIIAEDEDKTTADVDDEIPNENIDKISEESQNVDINSDEITNDINRMSHDETAEETLDAEIEKVDAHVETSPSENVDVVPKVLGKVPSQLSAPQPDPTVEEAVSLENVTDSVNNADTDVTQSSSNSQNILAEFNEDADLVNQSNAETVNNRMSACQVVLFKIDFDENAPQIQQKEILPSTKKQSDVDSKYDGSSRSMTLHSKKTRGVLKNSKNIPSSSTESGKETASNNSPFSIPSSSVSEKPDGRLRKRFKKTAGLNDSKSVYTISSSEEDEIHVRYVLKKKKKIGRFKGKKCPSSIYKNVSKKTEQNCESKENPKNTEGSDASRRKTLKCVSLPIITEIIQSLKENSYKELMKVLSNQTSSKNVSKNGTISIEENISNSRKPRKKTVVASVPEKSVTGDTKYKVPSTFLKSDEGSSKQDDRFRTDLEAPFSRQSLRRNVKLLNYAESFESCIEDEISLKSLKSSKTKIIAKRQETNSDDVSVQETTEVDFLKTENDCPQVNQRRKVQEISSTENCYIDVFTRYPKRRKTTQSTAVTH